MVLLIVALTGCQPPAVDEPTPTPPGAITADFSASTTLDLAPLEVKFTDQSTGDITSWAWDFEDDGVADSSERNPSRVFLPQKNGVGAYRVRLTVTGPGGSATVCKHENPVRPQLSYIHVEEAISNVDFSAAHTAGNAPLRVRFACWANTVIDRTEWDFDGDGILETETGAEHDAIYYEVGARTIPVTAKARGFVPGNSASVTKNVDIAVPRNQKISHLKADGTVNDEQKICAPDGGEASGDKNFGRQISLIGDLNGDTFPEIAVASFDHSEQGSHKIWILFLSADGTVQSHAAITKQSFQPMVFHRLLIDDFSGIGDRDGDGIPDLAMAANNVLFILYMENNGSMKGFTFAGKNELNLLDSFGCYSVAKTCDLNGDGAADLLTGNPRDSDGGTEGALSCRGAVWLLFLGADGAPLPQ